MFGLVFWPLCARTLKKVHVTIPDCIRYIISVFCCNFKSQTHILASYLHTSLYQS